MLTAAQQYIESVENAKFDLETLKDSISETKTRCLTLLTYHDNLQQILLLASHEELTAFMNALNESEVQHLDTLLPRGFLKTLAGAIRTDILNVSPLLKSYSLKSNNHFFFVLQCKETQSHY